LVSNFEKLAEVFKNLGSPCVLLVGPTLAGPLETRWPMNGTSRDDLTARWMSSPRVQG